MPIRIASADDPRVADFLGLRGRDERSDRVIAESELVVRRLITSPFTVRSFLLSAKGYEKLHDVVDDIDAPVYLADSDVLREIVGFDLHRGVLASAQRRPSPTLADVAATATRLLVLEGSNDHENIGVLARSARGLGFDALVLDPTCADPYARRSVRVSMGEVLHLPVVRLDTWPEPLEQLARYGFTTWALTPAPDAMSLFEMAIPDRLALLAGAEGAGLSAAARGLAQFAVRIPMHHGVDSLNVGHAVAIAMAITSPPPALPLAPPP